MNQMDSASIIFSLSHRVIFILALFFIYGLLEPFFKRIPPQLHPYVFGTLFGGFAILNMQAPIYIIPGVFIDARGLMIVFAGIIYGYKAALTTTIIVITYRFSLAGIGAIPAAGSALTTALVGSLFHHYLPKYRFNLAWLAAIGMLTAGIAETWMLMLPIEVRWEIMRKTFFSMFVMNTIGLVLFGLLMKYQQQREETRQALESSEKRFRAIFDNAYQFTGLLSREGRFLEINQSMLEAFGVKREDAIGELIYEQARWKTSPEQQAKFKRAIADALEGKTTQFEANLSAIDDSTMMLDYSLKPITDQSGRVIQLISEGRDISYRTLLEQKTIDLEVQRQRTDILKQFMDDASHHLRTPIAILRTSTYIMGKYIEKMRQQVREFRQIPDYSQDSLMSDLLNNLDTTTQKMAERIPIYDENLTRLQQIVEDMLHLIQLEDHTQFEFATVDLNEIVSMLVIGNLSLTEDVEKHVSIDFMASENALPVKIDESYLLKMIGYLMTHAIQAIHHDGHITLRTYQQEDIAVIEVRDDGASIAPDQMALLFERSFRAPEAADQRSYGSGLQLAIAKKIVDVHHGTIEAESEAGVGNMFRVRLPLKTQPSAAQKNRTSMMLA